MTVSNLTPPTISGTATQGQTLTAGVGTWNFDLDYLTYAYQWERCDAGGASCVDIAGATNAAYVLQGADVGSTIRVEVTATEHSNPVDPGNVIWNGDLSTGNESQFSNVIEYASDRFRVTTSADGVNPRPGYTYMARVECRQGEPTTWAASLSATLGIKNGLPIGVGTANTDTYMGWSAWIPNDWPYLDPTMHSIFVEYHGYGPMQQAPFHWGILASGSNAGRFFIDLHRAQTGYSPIFQPAFEALSDVADAWHDYTVRILWSASGTGKVTYWRDQVQKFDYTGATSPLSGEGIKPQFGAYCKNGPPTSKHLYLSAMRIGSTYASVQP